MINRYPLAHRLSTCNNFMNTLRKNTV